MSYLNKIKEISHKYCWYVLIGGGRFFFIGLHLVVVTTPLHIQRILQGEQIAIAETLSNMNSVATSESSSLERVKDGRISVQEIYSRRLKDKTVQWHDAWLKRSVTFFDFYWPEAYTTFQGTLFQDYLDKEKQAFENNQWIESFYGEIHIEKEAGYWVSWFPQYLHMQNSSTEGIRRLYWKENEQGELKVVGMKWIPQDLDLESSYLENVASRVTSFVESWRFAWEKGDVEKYALYYAEDAVQGERHGKSAIVEHKKSTWSIRRPKEVFLSGLRVMAVKDGIQVDMAQNFYDALAYSDKGIKTLLLRPTGKSWVIIREDWSEILQ